MRTRNHLLMRKPGAARLWLPLVALLIASLACSLPGLDQTSPTPAPTIAALPGATQAVVPSGPAQQPEQPTGQPPIQPQTQLPPALVEANPPPGSELAPGDAPVFYFNQPMERDSVEEAFAVDGEPAQSGQLEWIDDSAVRFVPETAEGLDISIGESARGVNGIPLAAPLEIHYQAPGPFSLTERLPAPSSEEVNPSSAVVATFNRPVTALGAEAESQPAAFTLEPPPRPAANG